MIGRIQSPEVFGTMKQMMHDKEERERLLTVLQTRFFAQIQRHADLAWEPIARRLESSESKLDALFAMEATGGEPDVIGYDQEKDAYLFCDCAPESPVERRSLCYDRAGLESRKSYPPRSSACDEAAAMGVELLHEQEYLLLQTKGAFDCKSSSWIATPDSIRRQGGALYGDRHYDRVFIYHNGAQSYYASRGFRSMLWV